MIEKLPTTKGPNAFTTELEQFEEVYSIEYVFGLARKLNEVIEAVNRLEKDTVKMSEVKDAITQIAENIKNHPNQLS